MAATDSITLAWINYCCREGYYRQLQTVCLDSLKKYGNDPVLVFWKAFGMMMEDNLTEAIQEFQSIKDKRDVVVCSLMALITTNKKLKTADKSTMQELEAKLKSSRSQCGEMALYFGSMFLLHSGKADKAREYVDRMLKMSNGNVQGLIMKGWADLKGTKEHNRKKSIKYFEEALESSVKEVDALIGKVQYMIWNSNFSVALDTVNQLIVMYPDFYPGLVEKLRIQFALLDWEQVVETSSRVLSFDSQNIEALHVSILELMCKQTNNNQAVEKMTVLIKSLDQCEPNNPKLYANFSKCYARLCGRHPNILLQTLTLIDRARSLAPKNAEYMNELGYQLLLQGDLKDSLKAYRQAMKIDESSVAALTGIIQCQILEEKLDDADQQLEFFNEIQSSIGKTPEILYLSALSAMKKGKSREVVMKLLQETIEAHFSKLTGLPLSSKYYELLNPDFLLQLLDVVLMYAPTEPSGASQTTNSALSRCITILDPIVTSCPGLMMPLYSLAKVKFIAGDIDAAKLILNRCLESDATFVNAHILMAQIHLHSCNYSTCEASLENGLSYNFDVKDMPIYHIIKAKIQKEQQHLNDALKTLTTAMNIPGVKKALRSSGKSKLKISTSHRVIIYLELADVQSQLKMQHEATKTIQDAISEFAGTPEEIKVTIANADMTILRGDIEQALTLLRQIEPEQSYYIQAREKMADIYLKHRKDKRLYTSVYRELVDKKPSTESYLLLGDAYMNIQEPEKAISIYEAALKKNPREGHIARKIGGALIKTHQYLKAINYYETALRTGSQYQLRFDLTELHMKLKNYEKAERILKQTLKGDGGSGQLQNLMDESRCSFLLSQVFLKRNESEAALQSLLKAKELQGKVIKRVGVEQPDEVAEQRQLAARICCNLGDFYAQSKSYVQAIKSYKEAIYYNDGDVATQLLLSKLCLFNGDLDLCQQQLLAILKNNKDHDQATMMLADVMFRKGEYDAAMFHFQQILERNPVNFDALAKLVELVRRTGKLEDCERFMNQAKIFNPRAPMEAGFNFCKGLYEWYRNNASEALKYFNFARKDNTWGERALYSMVEICLNPDSDIVGAETLESVEENDSSSLEKADSESVATRTAEKLLSDMKPDMHNSRHRILENYVLMATKNNGMVQKALSNLMEIAQVEKDNVTALVALSTAYMLLKQSPKARNQLKRVAKMDWIPEEGDEFEKTWLLLADIYIQSGKHDMGLELLKKCIEHNKSCSKAWEYMGFIKEKKQSYAEASTNYENAWKYSYEANPAIGYRLAFNYMKARRFVDAIDVCHSVLGKYPKYPKIRKDIMDKARTLIRT